MAALLKTDFAGVDMVDEGQCPKITIEFGQHGSKNIQVVAVNVILERRLRKPFDPFNECRF